MTCGKKEKEKWSGEQAEHATIVMTCLAAIARIIEEKHVCKDACDQSHFGRSIQDLRPLQPYSQANLATFPRWIF